MTSRRSFLKGLLAAPAAARHLGEKIILGVTDPGLGHPPAFPYSSPDFGSVEGVENNYLDTQIARYTKRLEELLLGQLDPEEYRTTHKYARTQAFSSLDPDLYTSRSLSLSAKIHLQTQRNLNRLLEEKKIEAKSLLQEFIKNKKNPVPKNPPYPIASQARGGRLV